MLEVQVIEGVDTGTLDTSEAPDIQFIVNNQGRLNKEFKRNIFFENQNFENFIIHLNFTTKKQFKVLFWDYTENKDFIKRKSEVTTFLQELMIKMHDYSSVKYDGYLIDWEKTIKEQMRAIRLKPSVANKSKTLNKI